MPSAACSPRGHLAPLHPVRPTDPRRLLLQDEDLPLLRLPQDALGVPRPRRARPPRRPLPLGRSRSHRTFASSVLSLLQAAFVLARRGRHGSFAEKPRQGTALVCLDLSSMQPRPLPSAESCSCRFHRRLPKAGTYWLALRPTFAAGLHRQHRARMQPSLWLRTGRAGPLHWRHGTRAEARMLVKPPRRSSGTRSAEVREGVSAHQDRAAAALEPLAASSPRRWTGTSFRRCPGCRS